MLIKEQVLGFANKVFKTRGGLWVPGGDVCIPKHNNILAILGTPKGKFLIPSHNIVTDAGDIFYAQKMAGESPTNNFNSCYLSTVDWTTGPGKTSTSSDIASMIAGSEKAVTATYPKTNDGDADNTGAGIDVNSWLFSWAKADFNDTDIDAGAISTASVPAWGSGGTVLLTGFDFSPAFGKTANDTLKLFVNHTANGV